MSQALSPAELGFGSVTKSSAGVLRFVSSRSERGSAASIPSF